MSTSLEFRLHAFARDLIEWRGGVVDWPVESPEGQALLPEDMASLLGASESARLAHTPLDGCLSPNLATGFIERAAALFEGSSRAGVFQIGGLYLKRSPIQPLIEQAFTWHHVQVRPIETVSGTTEYQTWFFHAAVHADDSWEDVVPVTVNAETKSALSMPDLLDREDLQPCESCPVAPPDTYQSAARHATTLMDSLSRDFVRRAQGRLARDQNRIHDYYKTLLRQAKVRLQKAKTDNDIEKQRNLTQAVELELKRKLLDMEEQYTVRGELEPILLARVTLPVLFTDYNIVRRKARRQLRIFWNPILKAIEPLACHLCGQSIFSIHFLDDRLEPTCGDCLKSRT